MARITMSAAGDSDPVTLNVNQNNFKVSLFLTFTGTATATAEFSPDGVEWFTHDVLNAVSAGTAGNLFFPVVYLRLSVGAYTSGDVNLDYIQGA